MDHIFDCLGSGGPQLLFQQLVNGLAKGSIYSLIALGYTMVYGIVELINFRLKPSQALADLIGPRA